VPAHCINHGGHAPSHLPAQVTTTNEGEKMKSLGFKGEDQYFIPINESEGHVGHMQAPRCRLRSLGASGPHAFPARPIQILLNFTFSCLYFILFIFFFFFLYIFNLF
jgi:hypothetical protein